MSTEQPEETSLKRKRTQRSNQGPKSNAKRQKADNGLEEQVEPAINGTHTTDASDNAGEKEGELFPPSTGPATGSKTAQQATTLEVKDQSKDLSKTQNRGLAKEKEINRGWTLSKAVGGRFVHRDPKFSSDGQFLFAAKENQLRVLSLEDSVLHQTIPRAGKGIIRAFATSRVNPDRVYIGYSGRVKTWDLEDLRKPVHKQTFEGDLVQLAIGRAAKEDEEVLYTLVRNKGFSNIQCGEKVVFKTKTPLQDIVIAGDALVGFGKSKLVAGRLNQDQTLSQLVEWDISNTITSLAVRKFNSTSSKKRSGAGAESRVSLALGTTTGEIYVYEDVVVAEKASSSTIPIPRNLHWHRDAVGSVKWSRDGNYLISGGKETSLVIWQLATGKKQHLPHLSAEIEHITVAPNGTSYALQLADNSIMVLSTSELKPIAHFPDLQAQLPLSQALSAMQHNLSSSRLRMVGGFHPVHKNQLQIVIPPTMAQSASANSLPSRPFVQAFDIASGHHLYRQALTRNKVTDLKTGPEGKPILEPDVYLMQLSFDGIMMATVETWEPPASDYKSLTDDRSAARERARGNSETYLKFWRWDSTKSCWAMQNRISNPHGGEAGSGRVFALVADPTAMRFFTLGEDSTVRSWTPRQPSRTATASSPQEWSSKIQVHLPSSELILPGSEELEPSGTLAISPDASVLACTLSASPSSTTIHLLNTFPLQPLAVLPPVPGQVHSLTLSTRTLCAFSTEVLTQFDIPTLRPTATVVIPPPRFAIPLPTRPRLLSTSPSAPGLVCIAHPSADPDQRLPTTQVEIVDLSLANRRTRFRTRLPAVVTGIAPDPALRSAFLLVTGDSAVVRLQGPRDAAARTADATRPRVVGEKVDKVPEPAPAAIETQEVEEDDAGERRVVRPEQLARLFEGAAGAVPVRAMYEGVLGLFAPRVVSART